LAVTRKTVRNIARPARPPGLPGVAQRLAHRGEAVFEHLPLVREGVRGRLPRAACPHDRAPGTFSWATPDRPSL